MSKELKFPVLSFQKTFHVFRPTSLSGPSRFRLRFGKVSGWRGSTSTTAPAFRRNVPRQPTLDLSLLLPDSRLLIHRLCISIPVDSTVPRNILPAFDDSLIEMELFRGHLYCTQPNKSLERTAYMCHGGGSLRGSHRATFRLSLSSGVGLLRHVSRYNGRSSLQRVKSMSKELKFPS